MILLFEHNLKAFNSVKSTWNNTNKTCVIHATGTGKSLIIAKNIEENPNSKHLFLSPSTFIFEEIKKHLSADITKKILFQSYAYFLDKTDLTECFLNLDFIYLDEFHRVGATKWGNGIENILALNPQAKVLGTSATPIRYLDDNRNMAEELFNNNIASELPLAQAILQGIHKKPIYVTALYNYKEILSKTKINIQKSNLDNLKKDQELERLRSVEINWNNSRGIDEILKKYLNVERKKILVFCRDTEHRKETLDFLKPILDKIYNSKINYYNVGSDFSEKINFDIISNFRNDLDTVSVLFSINMLNEGLHIDGSDTCIFFRDTSSPIVYFQQLGRVFHTNQLKQPLIIDLINNFKLSVGVKKFAKETFKSYGNIGFSNVSDLSLIIDFKDEITDFKEIIDSFNIDVWEKNYITFKEELFIINSYDKMSKKSKAWLNECRGSFKKYNIHNEKTNKLDSLISFLGFDWKEPILIRRNDDYYINKISFFKKQYQESGKSSSEFKKLLNVLRTKTFKNQTNIVFSKKVLKSANDLKSVGINYNYLGMQQTIFYLNHLIKKEKKQSWIELSKHIKNKVQVIITEYRQRKVNTKNSYDESFYLIIEEELNIMQELTGKNWKIKQYSIIPNSEYIESISQKISKNVVPTTREIKWVSYKINEKLNISDEELKIILNFKIEINNLKKLNKK